MPIARLVTCWGFLAMQTTRTLRINMHAGSSPSLWGIRKALTAFVPGQPVEWRLLESGDPNLSEG